MRLVHLYGVLVLALLAPASLPAQDAQTPVACAGLARDSAEAAILGCFRPTTPPMPVIPDMEPAPEPVVEAPPPAEPVPEALEAPLPTAAPEPLGDAAIADPDLSSPH